MSAGFLLILSEICSCRGPWERRKSNFNFAAPTTYIVLHNFILQIVLVYFFELSSVKDIFQPKIFYTDDY